VSRPLEGVRVLDLSRLLPGPFASMVLADLGASVDKLEDPRAGDYARVSPPIIDGEGALFQHLNRGKRAITLDLKEPQGPSTFLRLIRHYDVLIESFRPGVMSRLGVGYEDLKAVNPALIYCAITGYGQTGELASRAGHDAGYLARAGVLSMTGPADGAPALSGALMADIGGGSLYGVIGILAALRQRDASGEGQMVDIAMCEGAAQLGIFNHTASLGEGYRGAGQDLLSGGIAPYQNYSTSDGRAVSLAALEPKFWMTFCSAVGLPADLEALHPGPHQVEWKRRVAEIIARRTIAEWIEFAKAHDCCLEPILTPEETRHSPPHTDRGSWMKVSTHRGGQMHQLRCPLGGPEQPSPAPARGAHTDEILQEAGLDASEIDALRTSNTVA